MKLEKYQIEEHNNKQAQQHKRKFEFVAQDVAGVEGIIQKLIKFQIAIPSWALGTGGTRFGRVASLATLKRKWKISVCCIN
jgi:L-rhamnose isomerase / sugar isomerase